MSLPHSGFHWHSPSRIFQPLQNITKNSLSQFLTYTAHSAFSLPSICCTCSTHSTMKSHAHHHTILEFYRIHSWQRIKSGKALSGVVAAKKKKTTRKCCLDVVEAWEKSIKTLKLYDGVSVLVWRALCISWFSLAHS